MSKMSELDHCVGELNNAAQSLTKAADSLTALFNGSIEAGINAEPKPPTLEEARAVLAELSRGGHTAAIRDIIVRHGANKLTEVDPGKYASILAEAMALI